MHETGIKLLQLMFKPGETICVSPNKYGYHSIPLENAFCDQITLLSPNPEIEIEYCSSDELKLVALNPIYGFRNDSNCLKFRNFLVEMDTGPLALQIQYIRDQLKMPYSAAIFSGGKSIHFLISLEQDLPDEEAWRTISEWILEIATMADENCKNPSRSIRIPGAKRDDSKQVLVEYKGIVKNSDLGEWLNKFQHLKPKKQEKREISNDGDPRYTKLKKFARDIMKYGPDKTKGRNKQWFSLGCEFALVGFTEDETLAILETRFVGGRDFKKKEWETTIKSAFKYIYANRKGDDHE